MPATANNSFNFSYLAAVLDLGVSFIIASHLANASSSHTKELSELADVGQSVDWHVGALFLGGMLVSVVGGVGVECRSAGDISMVV